MGLLVIFFNIFKHSQAAVLKKQFEGQRFFIHVMYISVMSHVSDKERYIILCSFLFDR